MAINSYFIVVILLMAINSYSIMVILLMVIGGSFINGY
jgi:hypothetical protein